MLVAIVDVKHLNSSKRTKKGKKKMKVVVKKNIYLDKNDKTEIKIWMTKKNMTYKELSQKLGISYVYLYDLLVGRKPLTKVMIQKFKDNKLPVNYNGM